MRALEKQGENDVQQFQQECIDNFGLVKLITQRIKSKSLNLL